MCKKILYSLVMSIIVLTCVQGFAFALNSPPTLTSVSPSSGISKPGVWKTFTCVYSDVNGAADLGKCRFIINTKIANAGGAYLIYDRPTNKLYINNNAGTALGGIVRGTVGTIQNENAIVDTAATTVTPSGNNLTIAWRVQFKPVMAGKNCNLYMMATDKSGISSACSDKGDYSVNAAPTLTSISPVSGIAQPGVWKTFTCVYTDLNTATDLTKCRFIINTKIANAGGAYLIYDKPTNKLYINNNAGTALGGIVRGTVGTIQNENAILDTGATTVTPSGNNLTITWRVQFKSTMLGKNNNLYMMASDVSGTSSACSDMGDYSVNAAPTVTSVSPTSGITKPSVWKTFTCVYSDVNGAADLGKCRFIINSSVANSGGAYLIYDKPTNKLYINSNAGTALGGIVRGTVGTIQNENAIVDTAATTVTPSGNNLTIAWRVQFKPVMAGKNCNLYMMATDKSGISSACSDKGDYSVNAAPTLTSVSPASGSVQAGAWKTFTTVYTDLNTAADLTKCRFIINSAISSSGGAYLIYDKATNKLYINNNAGTQTGGLVRGLTGTIENENAILDCGGTTATASGNNLTIAWKVQFKPTMTGKNCNLYMMATDKSGVSSACLSKGTCSITAPTVNSLIELGKARINSVVMMEPFNPTTAKTLMTEAKSYFQQAKDQDTNNAQANFGLAITDAAVTAQSMVDKYQDFFAEGEDAGPYDIKSAVATLQFMNLPNMVKGTEPLKGFVESYTKAATSLNYTTMSEESEMILNMQTDIKNVLRPMLSRVAGYLQIVETSGGTSFSFPIGTSSWDGYTLVDYGDVNLFHGALLATRWVLAIPASYNLNMGSWDVEVSPYDLDINHNGLLTPSEYMPASPCLTLTDSATMTGAKADMTTACDKIIAGINATLAETSDNYELIKWHTSDQTELWNEFNEIKSYVTQLKASMNSAVTVTVGEGEEAGTMRIFAGAWNTTPPADLKTMFPTMELVRWRNDWEQAYDYDMTEAENGFPDETLGGMFPDGAPGFEDESRKATWNTGFSGTLMGMTTYPGNGATNIPTDGWNPSITFNGYPPATVSMLLERKFPDNVWRGVRIWSGWVNGSTYYGNLDGSLWPNNNYRMTITDENAHVSVIRTFQTGSDLPFGQPW